MLSDLDCILLSPGPGRPDIPAVSASIPPPRSFPSSLRFPFFSLLEMYIDLIGYRKRV